jgi:hypothetical protein
MHMPIAAALLVAISLMPSSYAAEPIPSKSPQHTTGLPPPHCADETVLSVLRRIGPVDKNKAVNEVDYICFGMPPAEVLSAPRAQLDAWSAQSRREAAALVDKFAKRAKAEKAEEDQAGANYYLCLKRHAAALALNSAETAEVVARASLSACPTERSAVFNIYQRFHDDFSEGVMQKMEGIFLEHLLLEIVEQRAERGGAPTPAPPSASAETFDYSNPMIACYLVQSFATGAANCRDDPTVLPISVFRACASQERASMAQTMEPRGESFANAAERDKVMAAVRETLKPYIIRWIKYAQGGPDCGGRVDR